MKKNACGNFICEKCFEIDCPNLQEDTPEFIDCSECEYNEGCEKCYFNSFGDGCRCVE